jgi:ankyrin repeat protein
MISRTSVADQQIHPELDEAATLVPAVSTAIGSQSEFGAGLIVASSMEGLLIATADHVVRQGDQTASVSVMLKQAPDRRLPAAVLPQHDRANDLAVLLVRAADLAGIDACALPLGHIVSDWPVRAGQGVYPVGNPNQTAWQIPAEPDRVSEVQQRELVFQSTLLDHGHSGGGLFDPFGDLLGMIKADQAPYGIALRVTAIGERFHSWSLPFGTLAPSCPRAALPQSASGPAVPSAESHQTVRAAMIAAAGNWYRSGGQAALLDAIATGDLAAVERAFTTDTQPGNVGPGPLHLAVMFERPEIVKFLLLKGARKNQLYLQGNNGRAQGAPLHFATSLENLEIMHLLLEGGADSEAGAGLALIGTPLSLAARFGLVEPVKLLIRAGADVQVGAWCRRDRADDLHCPLAEAARAGQLQVLQLLEGAGAQLRMPDRDPSRLLSVAAEAGQTEVLRYLLSREVPVNCSQSCETPIHAALLGYLTGNLQKKHSRTLDAATLLLRAGADPNEYDGLLIMSMTYDDIPALKLLLQGGADPNHAGMRGTPLAAALRADNERAVELLRAYGATR